MTLSVPFAERRNIKVKNNRIPIFDLIRIIAALGVFVFHLNTHFGVVVTSGFGLNPIIKTGAVFMVCFFMLSGFSLYYSYYSKNLFDNNNLKKFLQKRLLSIVPLYYVFFVYVLISHYAFPKTTGELWSLLPSFLILGQAFFPSTFNKLGAGGTWFLSVLLFLYVMFPMFQYVIKRMSKKGLKVSLTICFLFSVYPSIVHVYQNMTFAQLYSNPIYRLPEFVVGMLVAALCLENTQSKRPRYIGEKLIGLCLLFVFFINLLYYRVFLNGVPFERNYTFYNIIAIPIFALAFYYAFFSVESSNIVEKSICKLSSRKSIQYLSSITFAFYITQSIALRIVHVIVNKGIFSGDEYVKIALATMALNLVLAISAHEGIEKPLKRLALK